MSGYPAPGTPSDAERPASAVRVLKALHAAWQAAAIYEDNNHAYQARRKELLEALEAAFDSGCACRITHRHGYFFFDGARLNYDQSFSFGRALGIRFMELNLGEITIDTGVSPQSLDLALFALAHTDTRGEDPFAALMEAWMSAGIENITITPTQRVSVDTLTSDRESHNSPDRRRLRARAVFGRVEAVVQDMWQRVRDRNSFDASPTRRIVHQLIDQIARDEETLVEFTALKEFDEYTYYHSVNVAIYSIAVGMRLGFDRERLTGLGIAALFHDIGKVKLPRDLIVKPEEFDEDDWVQIKRHPVLGALTLANMRRIDASLGTAMAGAFEHHLRMDMSGYPKLSAPRTLHLFSRIIALCDAFDAMTSGRVYQKERISPEEAMRRLLHKGREWYDPVVLKAFVHVLGVFPVGTVVRLSDGAVAIVIRNNADDLFLPEVLVIRDAEGKPCRRLFTLQGGGSQTDAADLCIDEILDPDAEHITIGDYIGQVPNNEEQETAGSPQ